MDAAGYDNLTPKLNLKTDFIFVKRGQNIMWLIHPEKHVVNIMWLFSPRLLEHFLLTVAFLTLKKVYAGS